MMLLLRLIGILSFAFFGLLAFQNLLALVFSPEGRAGVTLPLLILFMVGVVGAVGLAFLKDWGRWIVCGEFGLILLIQWIGGRLILSGFRSPLLSDLLKHSSLIDIAMAAGLPVLIPMIGYFQSVAVVTMLVWSWIGRVKK